MVTAATSSVNASEPSTTVPSEPPVGDCQREPGEKLRLEHTILTRNGGTTSSGVQKGTYLPMLALEFVHERDKRVDAVLRKRVVDRRAHASDRSMAFQPVEAGRCRLFDESGFELFRPQPKRDV